MCPWCPHSDCSSRVPSSRSIHLYNWIFWLIAASSLPLKAFKEYTAPFVSFSAISCNFPSSTMKTSIRPYIVHERKTYGWNMRYRKCSLLNFSIGFVLTSYFWTKKNHNNQGDLYLGWLVFFWQNICSSNTIVHVAIIRKGAAKYGAAILKCVKWVCWYELKGLII